MNKKTIMIDMDEVIVVGKFSEFLIEFLGEVNFDNLKTQNRQDLLIGKEEEFKKIYKSKNLYKDINDNYIRPLPNCEDVIKRLNQEFEVYIVTSYIWNGDVIDAATNLKNKYDYLHYWFPFIDPNKFIFMADKTKLKFDIGIDDRVSNLKNCKQKLLFTEFRNKKIMQEELERSGVKRVNNWLEIEK